jgi:hypothetical protein
MAGSFWDSIGNSVNDLFGGNQQQAGKDQEAAAGTTLAGAGDKLNTASSTLGSAGTNAAGIAGKSATNFAGEAGNAGKALGEQMGQTAATQGSRAALQAARTGGLNAGQAAQMGAQKAGDLYTQGQQTGQGMGMNAYSQGAQTQLGGVNAQTGVGQAQTGVANAQTAQGAAQGALGGQQYGEGHQQGKDTMGAIGNAAGTIATLISDKRLKKDISVAPDMLDKILRKVKGVDFEYKDEVGDPGPQVGVIAQDLEKTPLASVVEDTPQGKAINTSKLSTGMLDLILEMGQRIKELEAKVGK